MHITLSSLIAYVLVLERLAGKPQYPRRNPLEGLLWELHSEYYGNSTESNPHQSLLRFFCGEMQNALTASLNHTEQLEKVQQGTSCNR